MRALGDANWGGNRDSRSTSSAQHFVSGQLVHSSSRNQHCIALSSTESEYYSLVSCAIDTLYLKHILEFMFPSKNVVATVYVDNSACRQIANKLGTGRLRHIQGKLLWIQHMTKSGQIKIKAVGTTWNPADLGTKTLSADRHRMLCYILNMLLDGGRMGERQYLRATQAHWNKQSIKEFCNVSFSNSSSTPHVQHNIVKRVVQLVCVSNIGMTQGVVCTTRNVLVSQQALSQPPVQEYDVCLCTARCSWF